MHISLPDLSGHNLGTFWAHLQLSHLISGDVNTRILAVSDASYVSGEVSNPTVTANEKGPASLCL